MPSDDTRIAREHVEAFVVHIRDTRSASTAETRFRGLRRFFAWCEDEGEIERSPMDRMRPLPARIVRDENRQGDRPLPPG